MNKVESVICGMRCGIFATPASMEEASALVERIARGSEDPSIVYTAVFCTLNAVAEELEKAVKEDKEALQKYASDYFGDKMT